MSKILFTLILIFVTDSLSQPIMYPTWKLLPLPRRTVTRTARAVRDVAPLWLYNDRALASADHVLVPKIIDDINLDEIKDTPKVEIHQAPGVRVESSVSRET